jgi:hypothetical protein
MRTQEEEERKVAVFAHIRTRYSVRHLRCNLPFQRSRQGPWARKLTWRYPSAASNVRLLFDPEVSATTSLRHLSCAKYFGQIATFGRQRCAYAPSALMRKHSPSCPRALSPAETRFSANRLEFSEIFFSIKARTRPLKMANARRRWRWRGKAVLPTANCSFF